MSSTARQNFVHQQGFSEVGGEACERRFPALMFQPRMIGFLVLLGLIFKSWPLFLALGVVSWWSALVPALNPFDALYNVLVAGPLGGVRLTPAPSPRRFSQGMAGTFMLGIGTSLLMGWTVAATVLEFFLVLALVLLLFGSFCLGSYLYHLFTGGISFANRTLPWTRS